MPTPTLRLNLSAIVALLLALRAVAASPQPPSGLPASRVARIEKAVAAFMATVKAPGLSVAIGLDGKIRFENGYGLADIENAVPATASTVYRLASVSKPITAVATMQLVERGRLRLEDTVGQWLSDMPVALQPITVRQLLSHQSGIRHYTAEEDDSSKHYPQHYASLRDALTIFRNDPLVHAPGASMTYSTYGYTLLGVIIEEASGRSYVDFVNENIFRPLGMTHSRPDDPHAIVPNRSRGYARTGAGSIRNAGFVDPSYKIPGGGWLSTVGDMVRFGLAVQAGALLKPESVRQMTTMQRVGGTQDTTNLYLLMAGGPVVAVMTNIEGEGLALTKLASEITNIVLER
jgi:serine beta-lactamase-like protein LACTB